MIQHILKLIWTQRRRNLWIFAELLVVFALAWYIVDYQFVLIHNRMLPNGYDVADTYRISYKSLTDKNKEAFRQFYDRVRLYPGVESAFLTDRFSGVMPYSDTYNGISISVDSTGNSQTYYGQMKAIGSNNYFEVFKVHSVVNPSALGRLDRSNSRSVVLTQNLAEALFKGASPMGKRVFMNGKSEYVVTDVVQPQKQYDHAQPHHSVFYYENDTTIAKPEIAIRVAPNFSFEQFKKEVSGSIVSYKNVGRDLDFMLGVTNEIRLRTGLMIFFLLNVALGIIGTFWFRNAAKHGEIGLRMALGSSRSTIQKQYIAEAVLLLTLAAVPAVCVNFTLLEAGVIKTLGEQFSDSGYITANKWLRFIITNGLTYLLLAVIVALSAWIPANKASKVHPVEALRDNG